MMGFAHSHGHSHGADLSKDKGSAEAVDRALGWAFFLNGGFLIIEATAGWFTGSLALLSDAVHMVGDVGALALAYTVRRLARTAATAARTYGMVGAETLGAFVNSLALLAACVFLIWEAFGRLNAPPEQVSAWPVILVGTAGLAINLGSAWKLFQSDRTNLNVRGALLHMLADALGSVGAVVAGIFLSYGVLIADPLVALLIAAIVIVSAAQLLRETGSVLLQFAPASQSADEILVALQQLSDVEGVHDLHLWTLDGQETILSAHLLGRPGIPPDQIRLAAEDVLRSSFGIRHTTLQTEADDSCESDCQVWSPEADMSLRDGSGSKEAEARKVAHDSN